MPQRRLAAKRDVAPAGPLGTAAVGREQQCCDGERSAERRAEDAIELLRCLGELRPPLPHREAHIRNSRTGGSGIAAEARQYAWDP